MVRAEHCTLRALLRNITGTVRLPPPAVSVSVVIDEKTRIICALFHDQEDVRSAPLALRSARAHACACVRVHVCS